jgi:hypothetical protein
MVYSSRCPRIETKVLATTVSWRALSSRLRTRPDPHSSIAWWAKAQKSHVGRVGRSHGQFRVHMNLRRFLPAFDAFAVRLLTAVSFRSGIWAPLLMAPGPRLVAPNATARASFSVQSNARISFSVTPSRRIRCRIAASSNSSSRDGSAQHPLTMTSFHHDFCHGH